ncbi:MspA family porin [Gordonia sp. PP30]|uniref:MspA family porin n=1 Tax=unclassified Gordonia (in: high G+C Gram-positive bacteria) TaxID=2657482 RepID=UPI001FFF0FE1|nr:MspA family porin [Gordonia sp. PP30]UQE75389.1 MspA family porin [Gordonia sp. PP30]
MREIKVMKTGATALFVAIGLGFVLGPTPAGATPTPLHSKHDRLATDDGWTMELNASELVVNPMHNLAETPTSREGWISSKVEGRVAGDGKEPVQAAILEHFLVVGCGVDVSDGTTLGLSASAGPSVGVTISGVPSATLGASASVSPSISAHIRPGKITELSLGKKQLQGDHASIRVKRARVSVDGCLGKTSVRIIARTADDTINVF